MTQAERDSLIFLQDWNLKRGRKSCCCCWSVSHIFNHVSMLFIPIKTHFQRIKWDPIKHDIISYKNKRFYPALRTAPVQLKDAAAPLFRNGDWWPWCWWCPPVSDSPPSSSSLTAVVRDNRSSSDIYKKGGKRTRHFETFLLFNGSCASWRFSIRRIIPHFPFLLLIVQSERTGAKRVKTIKKKKSPESIDSSRSKKRIEKTELCSMRSCTSVTDLSSSFDRKKRRVHLHLSEWHT